MHEWHAARPAAETVVAPIFCFVQVDKGAAMNKLELARPALEEAEAALQVTSTFASTSD